MKMLEKALSHSVKKTPNDGDKGFLDPSKVNRLNSGLRPAILHPSFVEICSAVSHVNLMTYKPNNQTTNIQTRVKT